jgi:uncharacterized protein YrrD
VDVEEKGMVVGKKKLLKAHQRLPFGVICSLRRAVILAI